MATSGSIDQNLTAREVVEFALRKLRVIRPGESADAEDAEDARIALSLMLKSWQKYRWLWLLTEGSLSLTDATQSYTLSPKPYEVVSARYKDSTEIPMLELTREEYFDLPDKASTGIPTQYYYDRQQASGVLYVWPVLATATTETIEYTYRRVIEDIDSLNNDLDVRQEYLELVGYNLAKKLIPDHGKGNATDALVIQEADRLLSEALDDDRPSTVRFVPDDRY